MTGTDASEAVGLKDPPREGDAAERGSVFGKLLAPRFSVRDIRR
jgi:hypothetical protein